MNEDVPQVRSRGLHRRSFLVSVGSFLLGWFVMPNPLPALRGEGGQPPEEGKEGIDGRIRCLIGRPVKTKDGRVLSWLEEFEDGEPHVMIWELETKEEREEGRRFFEIATWRSWNNRDELERILATDPGPWLIRYNMGETYEFFTSRDFKYLLGDNEILSPDPQDAVQVSSREALRLIITLMPVYGGGFIYVEPVKPADALRNFRAERFGLNV
jgi:hypothetical protein